MKSDETMERLPGSGAAWTAAIIVVAISLLSAFTLSDPENEQVVVANGGTGDFFYEDGQGEGAGAGTGTGDGGTSRVLTNRGSAGSGGTGSAGSAGSGSGPGAGGPGVGLNVDCGRNQNAGASDVGVSGTEIRFGATVAKTGIAKDFLADAEFGIEAVVQKANREGGICGRLIKVDYENDEWKTDNGARIINKWIGGKRHFGLLVNPSSEGLRGALDGGQIEQAKFPVVGADGMLIGQYRSDWVWPVATSTYSVMHIMAKDAYQRGKAYWEKKGQPARKPTFGIVWEKNYKFGEEGHTAFVATIERMCGKDCVKADQPIIGGELSYKNPANDFIGDCKTNAAAADFSQCDFVAVLLEPATAAQWVADGGLGSSALDAPRPVVGIGAPQPLFVDSFIRKNCNAACANMWVWTSFKPPLHPFDRDPAVVEYVNDLRAVSSSADMSNPHVQGAYVGARLLIEALKQLGGAPTREGLREKLDQMTFDSKLAPPLKFAPDNHFAAVNAQAFEAIFNGQSFNNWQHVKDFVADDQVKQDLGKV